MHLLALDFDGVICDSAPENAATAWRCCRQLWPDEFPGTDVVPQEQLRRFCAARPYMETGYQAILMTRMMQAGAIPEDYTTLFADRLRCHVAASGMTMDELKKRFGDERDRWVKEELAGWLGYNRLYEGAAQVLEVLRQPGKDIRVIILTTKEDRFVKRILEHFGVPFDMKDIYGLERIRKKDIELQNFLECGKYERVAFVEDRLATLQRCETLSALNRLELAFAPWGYTTPEQRADAAADSRIRVLPDVDGLKNIFG